MRATRTLLRRRRQLRRKRAERLAHIHNTPRQDTLPEIGKPIADKANRAGGAARCPDPAVPKSLAVALALIAPDDPRLRDVELSIRPTAKQHAAHTRARLRTGPGIGAMLSLVRLSDIHDLQRFPRGQDVVASCRLGKGAKAAAGKRSGTAGTKRGNASRTGACSEAAVVCLRHHPQGQQELGRVEKNPGPGQALTGRAQKLARAVY